MPYVRCASIFVFAGVFSVSGAPYTPRVLPCCACFIRYESTGMVGGVQISTVGGCCIAVAGMVVLEGG